MTMMLITSKVAKANTTKSLRTTIPSDIAKEVDLKIGDLLIWSVDQQKGKKLITIKKVEG
jgi:bifunctional DNA-binding transcriptional regulator/antitoxin component of YhaV-PrlF toxin-antitoxin module